MRKVPRASILIAGGAGFIGSFLCERFMELGWEVFCVDNFSSGSQQNIEPFLANRRFHLIEHDITKPLSRFKGAFALILNFACVASVAGYQEAPIHTLQTCFSGTQNLLELAKRDACPFLLASTSEVYGDPEVHPQPESYWGRVNPIGPRSCYDEGKRVAESLCFSYKMTYQLDVRVIRIFNTYGPRMAFDDGRVVTNFISQALQGKEIAIYGDGSQTRSFCYIDDLLEAISRVLVLPALEAPLNLGSDRELPIRQLAAEVLELTGSDSKIVYRALPENDPKVRRPDLSKARQLLGWSPQTPLATGLRHTIDYLQETYFKTLMVKSV